MGNQIQGSQQLKNIGSLQKYTGSRNIVSVILCEHVMENPVGRQLGLTHCFLLLQDEETRFFRLEIGDSQGYANISMKEIDQAPLFLRKTVFDSQINSQQLIEDVNNHYKNKSKYDIQENNCYHFCHYVLTTYISNYQNEALVWMHERRIMSEKRVMKAGFLTSITVGGTTGVLAGGPIGALIGVAGGIVVWAVSEPTVNNQIHGYQK